MKERADKYQKMWNVLHLDASSKMVDAMKSKKKMDERLKKAEEAVLESSDSVGAEIDRAMLSYYAAEFNGMLKVITWFYKRMRDIEREIDRYED